MNGESSVAGTPNFEKFLQRRQRKDRLAAFRGARHNRCHSSPANGVIGPGFDADLLKGDRLMATDVAVPASMGLLLGGEQLDILAQRGRD